LYLYMYMKADKTDCSYYRGVSLLSTTYKILSNILLSRLTPYAGEITADHQHGFRRKRSTTNHIFCVGQILEKKWGYNEAAHKLFIDFKKACVSVRREALYRVGHKSVNTPVRHTSVNTPSSHERHVVRTWLAVYSGWGVKLYEMRDMGATAAILKAANKPSVR